MRLGYMLDTKNRRVMPRRFLYISQLDIFHFLLQLQFLTHIINAGNLLKIQNLAELKNNLIARAVAVRAAASGRQNRAVLKRNGKVIRSEEHTSELQSLA